jgi:hypothetical protein
MDLICVLCNTRDEEKKSLLIAHVCFLENLGNKFSNFCTKATRESLIVFYIIMDRSLCIKSHFVPSMIYLIFIRKTNALLFTCTYNIKCLNV